MQLLRFTQKDVAHPDKFKRRAGLLVKGGIEPHVILNLYKILRESPTMKEVILTWEEK